MNIKRKTSCLVINENRLMMDFHPMTHPLSFVCYTGESGGFLWLLASRSTLRCRYGRFCGQHQIVASIPERHHHLQSRFRRGQLFASLSHRCRLHRSQSRQLYSGTVREGARLSICNVTLNGYGHCVVQKQVLVWHTRTVQVPLATLRPPTQTLTETSIPALLHALDELKLATVSTNGINWTIIQNNIPITSLWPFNISCFVDSGKPSSVHYLTDVWFLPHVIETC